LGPLAQSAVIFKFENLKIKKFSHGTSMITWSKDIEIIAMIYSKGSFLNYPVCGSSVFRVSSI
jgi:hypothetical protein